MLKKIIQNSLLILFSVSVSVCVAEVFLRYWQGVQDARISGQIYDEAARMGVKFDSRDTVDVIKEFRERGEPAYPVFYEQLKTDGIPKVGGGKIFPFASVPAVTNVFCKEGGPWAIYKSDKFGFNNPSSVWDGRPVDMAFVGDSFTHGACVNQGEDFAGLMRAKGFNAVNFGMGGTGPLAHLAVLKEYVKAVRPKYVFWFFYAEDVRDIYYELQAPTLARYLNDPSFTQNLLGSQPELNESLKAFLDGEYYSRVAPESKISRLGRMLQFQRVRTLIKSGLARFIKVSVEPEAQLKVAALEKTFRSAEQIVSEWGGKIVFVYLPPWTKYALKRDSEGVPVNDNYLLKAETFRILSDLQIPIVDVDNELFKKHPDPVSLFNFRSYGHFTIDGYKLVTDVVESKFRNMDRRRVSERSDTN